MVWKRKKKITTIWTTGSPRGLAHLRASFIFFPKVKTKTEAARFFRTSNVRKFSCVFSEIVYNQIIKIKEEIEMDGQDWEESMNWWYTPSDDDDEDDD